MLTYVCLECTNMSKQAFPCTRFKLKGLIKNKCVVEIIKTFQTLVWVL